MNLYEINNAIQECINLETGEIDLELFEKLQLEKDEKIENVALWIKNLSSDVESMENEKKAFEERIKAAKNKIIALKTYLEMALNGEKFQTAKCSITFRKSKSVNVLDVSKLDKDYLKYADPTADKTAIKKAIESGVTVAGASLVENLNVQIK